MEIMQINTVQKVNNAFVEVRDLEEDKECCCFVSCQ